MKATILNGKELSERIKIQLKQKVERLKKQGIQPTLAVIQIGQEPASTIYVNNKKKTCQQIGVQSLAYNLPLEVTQQQVIELVDMLNEDERIHGILVQLPLPAHIKERCVVERISPLKDVDCFHPENVGKLMLDMAEIYPCTPQGIVELIKEAGISPEGKHCVVVGKSNIVGKPASMMMLNLAATVTTCHSKTKNLKEITTQADILIVAVGRAKIITKAMVKPGAVVIDVGINRSEEGKVVGDVDFEAVGEIASAITPVPGGVGPMTIAMLMKNLIALIKKV